MKDDLLPHQRLDLTRAVLENGLGSHITDVEPSQLITFVKVKRASHIRLPNTVDICADTILWQLHLHSLHYLRKALDSVSV